MLKKVIKGLAMFLKIDYNIDITVLLINTWARQLARILNKLDRYIKKVLMKEGLNV